MLLPCLMLLSTSFKQSLPPVEINHCFMVLDKETQDAIGHNEFITKTFARTSYNHVVSGKDSWDALYLHGKGTYLELFVPFQGATLGLGGIALSVEKIGSSDLIYQQIIKTDKDNVSTQDRTFKDKKGVERPWYHGFFLQGDSNMPVWVMDVSKESYESDNIPVPASLVVPKNAGNKPPKEMGDIVEITATIAPDKLDQQARLLTLSGFKSSTEGTTRVLAGPDVTIRLNPIAPGARRAIREVKLALMDKPKDEKVLRLGHSTLSIHKDGTAVWDFDD